MQLQSGVYRIALCDSKLRYPKNNSSVIFIGAAPSKTLTERLKDHLRGKGNQCVYQRYKNSERMRWQILITDSNEDNDDKALQEFLAAFGGVPACNARTVGTTAQ